MKKCIAIPLKDAFINQKRNLAAAAVMTAAAFAIYFSFPSYAAGGLELSTDYPGISVKPGDSLSLPVSLQNTSGAGMDVDVEITGMPEGWDGYLQGGSYEVSQVHVGGGTDNTKNLTMRVTVPKELSEGSYAVTIRADNGAGASDDLSIQFSARESMAGQGSFTSEYPEQQGMTGTDFSFSTNLVNNDLKPQSYSLSANAPAGWNVSFTPSGQTSTVASVEVESGVSQGITVKVEPPKVVEAGDYTITVNAVSAGETLSEDLKVTITGTSDIELSTPDGRLSFDAYAGKESDVTLSISNTGNVDLENVSLNSSAPSGWTVTYDQEESVISSLPAGTTTEVIAHVKPASGAITGDYVSSFSVSAGGISDKAEFRVSVKTRTVWGLAAVLVIVATAGGLGYVFKKYGRR